LLPPEAALSTSSVQNSKGRRKAPK
jgi:hypothetical protein